MPTMRKVRGLAMSSVYVLTPPPQQATLARFENEPVGAHTPTYLSEDGQHWRDMAACKGSKLNFVPINASSKNAAACKAVCAECPVKTECLQWALNAEDNFAICGGLTPKERKAL